MALEKYHRSRLPPVSPLLLIIIVIISCALYLFYFLSLSYGRGLFKISSALGPTGRWFSC